MIQFTQGNLLQADVEALVNTVNEVGVMGKGIALMFKEAFPDSARSYEDSARKGEVRVGRVLVTESNSLLGPRWIIHFPTKKHWRQPSQLQWVRDGLRDLVRAIREWGIKSIALPPLGCGSGGLQWDLVKREIEAALSVLPDIRVVVFEPTSAYMTTPKREGVASLTPSRALIAELVRRYCILGLECTNLEVQKLAWFLSRVIRTLRVDDPLGLKFTANKYGPYADGLRHLLNALDGSYLHCEKRLSDAGPFDTIWFEDSKRQLVEEFFRQKEGSGFEGALEATARVIDGFESPLGMELLSTVDWLVSEGRIPAIPAEIFEALPNWPGGSGSAGRRKAKLFDRRMIELALNRLVECHLAPAR